jgi:hypothetical protein
LNSGGNQTPGPEIKPGRGGKRPGAGRKPKPKPQVTPAPSEGAAIESPAPPADLPQPLPRPRPRRSELVAIAAAANAGWAIPEDEKARTVQDCIAIRDDESSSPRERMSATRCLLAIERLSQFLASAATAGLAPLAPDLEALIARVYGDSLGRTADQPAA